MGKSLIDPEKARESLLEAAQNLGVADSPRVSGCTKVIIGEAVNDLIEALGTGDIARVEQALDTLGAQRDSSLYLRVGHMARSLHNSLCEFADSLRHDNISMHHTNIPDAAVKLENVIKMTFEAAERTMNLVDEQAEIIKQQHQLTAQAHEALADPKLSPEKLHQVLGNYVSCQEQALAKLDKISGAVIMAQEFQDLSGQSLRKVVVLVQELEKNLLTIVELFGIKAGYNSVTPVEPEKEEIKAVAQDDVDKMLSEFGF